eukprot:TRINITY_DN113220_c0_g1_i1.p1 TRINITY_DN113220_c0_g1~~TRINITY_DN113220_c0_g1_i1.p1  ORF type:complete len:118 (-),score=10.98 TRINITY_DN113220_c0_g1_i1:141-443(-)
MNTCDVKIADKLLGMNNTTEAEMWNGSDGACFIVAGNVSDMDAKVMATQTAQTLGWGSSWRNSDNWSVSHGAHCHGEFGDHEIVMWGAWDRLGTMYAMLD